MNFESGKKRHAKQGILQDHIQTKEYTQTFKWLTKGGKLSKETQDNEGHKIK